MCRNITTLRGLEPPATTEEITAAARQYVRKVTGLTTPTAMAAPEVEGAVQAIAELSAALLAVLPPRRVPPKTSPPLRRRAAAS